MTIKDKITTKSGIQLFVEKSVTDTMVEVRLRVDRDEDCLLHWGLRRNMLAPWEVPPREGWPQGSLAVGENAMQSPFLRVNNQAEVTLKYNRSLEFSVLEFVLLFPEENRWDNNRGRNYRITIPLSDVPTLSPIETLRNETREKKVIYEHVYHLDHDYELAVTVVKDDEHYVAALITDIPGPLVLHWGVAKKHRDDWLLPEASMRPANTGIFQDRAAESAFVDHGGHQLIELNINEEDAPRGILFVLKLADTDQWLNNRGGNFYVPILMPPEYGTSFQGPNLSGLADEIISKEMSRNSWTLMHRFNLCYDLLDKASNSEDALALIFVWLRFSALRQLDWQRDYNTKPRELSHAMDRLTLKLGDHYANNSLGRPLIRLILTTMGRGGEGQKIRDEVLNIMHRHKIKEVSGHFMEEWHQKLHNNTTPDDVVICEAYLEFLKSNGTLDSFYSTLEAGGVAKERLKGYERPINSVPDFIPHLKDALIQDFVHFLGVLKEAHSATDLGTAIHAARHVFDESMHGWIDFIWQHRDAKSAKTVCALVENVTNARDWIAKQPYGDSNKVRDLLFLDLALEDFLRIAVERSIDKRLGKDRLVELIILVLENLDISHHDEELTLCLHHWRRLKEDKRPGKDWALHAKAALDRLGRATAAFVDRYYDLVQPKAELLGKAFHADDWTVRQFSEEVIRGQAAFVLSLVLSYLDPMLRKSAKLGDWQLINPGEGAGNVEVVTHLRSVQGKEFAQPTIVVADEIAGDEEIPKAVTAIITPDTTDIVSHVAIRARNARVFFATCYSPEVIKRLKSFRGQFVRLAVDAAGNVLFDKTGAYKLARQDRVGSVYVPMRRPVFKGVEAVSATAFDEEIVGEKSLNLRRLKGKLPEWIHFPKSIALPFGAFEKVLAESKNRGIAVQYEKLLQEVGNEQEKVGAERLDELRNTILALEAPDGFYSSICYVMEKEGVELPENQEDAWSCIKRVWGSKWNQRAYLSRVARGIPHEDLFMAVLIQEVVEAEYGFVIHTCNPVDGNQGEVYAEVVLGLGETLVGNYPGRALGFTCSKKRGAPRLTSFPSKGAGLFGGRLIFRSDSNGEDLSGFAGAGLYDSVMLPPARKRTLDYANERLLWDNDFRNEILATIAGIGKIIEEALDYPQDIEGAYSKGEYYVVQTRAQVGIGEKAESATR